jgi:hypothetical protein
MLFEAGAERRIGLHVDDIGRAWQIDVHDQLRLARPFRHYRLTIHEDDRFVQVVARRLGATRYQFLPSKNDWRAGRTCQLSPRRTITPLLTVLAWGTRSSWHTLRTTFAGNGVWRRRCRSPLARERGGEHAP